MKHKNNYVAMSIGMEIGEEVGRWYERMLKY